jgi:hypothetical protein
MVVLEEEAGKKKQELPKRQRMGLSLVKLNKKRKVSRVNQECTEDDKYAYKTVYEDTSAVFATKQKLTVDL